MPNPIIDKKIILGITGSIAAFKGVDLASKLNQSGALVDVILTESAQKFISPLSCQSVTSRKAYVDADLWGGEGHITHVGLGHNADLMLIAPISANTIAKLAHGIGDNLLSVTALAAQCPLIIAPAMDVGMYNHPATQINVEILRKRGITIIGPDVGHLASGLTGLGRFVEPTEIIGHIRLCLGKNGLLNGKKVIVTAGGTQEPIDPVRFITNRSSGKQGYAIAQAAVDNGAEVILISAPTSLDVPIGVKLIQVMTVSDMLEAVMGEISSTDTLIMAAAPSDFHPTQIATQKIKKDSGFSTIHLEPTSDILSVVAINKSKTGYPKKVIGFAAESQNLLENAKQKLKSKALDIIVANDITDVNAGFSVETNRVSLLYKNDIVKKLPILKKSEVADIIIQQIIEWG